jgi:hypothetical protein
LILEQITSAGLPWFRETARRRRRNDVMRSLALCLLIVAPVAAEEHRQAAATGERHPLLELYTSEGCSSCPPAEAWLSANKAQLVARGWVPLAFHVDYWNQLGWPDPFSQARFTTRQELLARRDGGHLYTPELALDGHELQAAQLSARLREAPRPARAKLTLEVTGQAPLHVTARATETTVPVRVSVAVFENGISVNVPRGENAGKTLAHDFVVRALFSSDGNELTRAITTAPEWNVKNVGLAAFVEDARTGELLQAVALPP